MASLSEDEKREECFQKVLFALKIQLLTSLGRYVFILCIEEFVSI